MKQIPILYLLVAILLASCNSTTNVNKDIPNDSTLNAQENNLVAQNPVLFERKNIQKVLKDSVPGECFNFSIPDTLHAGDTIEDSYTHCYLGNIKTTKGKYYKCMNSIHEWVKLPERSSYSKQRLEIYSKENKKIGYYYFESNSDLPEKIENNQLVFKTDFCSQKLNVSFGEDIPESISLLCPTGGISAYRFLKEE